MMLAAGIDIGAAWAAMTPNEHIFVLLGCIAIALVAFTTLVLRIRSAEIARLGTLTFGNGDAPQPPSAEALAEPRTSEERDKVITYLLKLGEFHQTELVSLRAQLAETARQLAEAIAERDGLRDRVIELEAAAGHHEAEVLRLQAELVAAEARVLELKARLAELES